MEKSTIINSMFDGRSHHGAFRQHIRHRWKWWLIARSFVCIALVILGTFIAIKYSGKGNKLPDFISVAFILLGSVGLIRPMIWQMFAERKFRKHRAYESKIRYEFSAKGIKMSGKAGKADVPWSTFYEVAKTPKGLLIYQTKKEYIWIPSYDFKAGEMKAICEMFGSSKNPA